MRFKLSTISSFQIFHLIRYFTLIVTGIVFAKGGLSQHDIGVYETFIFLAGAVSFFWLNGLLKALLPVSSKEEHSSSAVFSAFVVISLFSFVVAVILFFIHPVISSLLLHGSHMPYPILMSLFIIFGTPANIVEYYYLIKKRSRSLIIYGIISFAVQFLMVITPVLAGLPLSYVIGGLVISSLLRYGWLWWIFISHSQISFSKSFVKEHLRLGGPLVVATLLSGTAQYVDGFIVTSKFDESVFAIFRYGARELPLAVLLTNALSNALLPSFGFKGQLKESLSELKENTARLMHFLFPVTALMILLSHPIFPVVFNPLFKESATIFNIYLLLVISRVMMPQTILTGLQQTRHLMIASFFELIINVGLSLLLVVNYGIAGVAFATFIAYLFEKIYLAVVVKSKLKIALFEYQPIKWHLIYSFFTVAIFIFAEIILFKV